MTIFAFLAQIAYNALTPGAGCRGFLRPLHEPFPQILPVVALQRGRGAKSPSNVKTKGRAQS